MAGYTYRAVCFFNMTSHPASHSFTTVNSEYAANPGIICPNLAFAGRCGSASVQVCVDYTLSPLGNNTRSGLFAGATLDFGATVTRK